MANGKTEGELDQTARNLCNTMGIDYNEAVQQFRGSCGMGFPNSFGVRK